MNNYKERLEMAEEFSKLLVKNNMPKQKFPRGTRVKVCKEMPSYMSHFESDFEAIVEYTYAQKYWGNNINDYSLIVLKNNIPVNTISWYKENQLTLINDDIQAGLKIIEEYNKI